MGLFQVWVLRLTALQAVTDLVLYMCLNRRYCADQSKREIIC